MKQKLSKKAAAAKRVRDKKYAMTARRRSMKAENQRLRRAFEKKHGKGSLKGKDYDHKRKKFVGRVSPGVWLGHPQKPMLILQIPVRCLHQASAYGINATTRSAPSHPHEAHRLRPG